MSGHSKWSTIKRKKGAVDAKRGKLFTKLIRAITVAARDSGDINSNPRLRIAVEQARAANMPNDNIERAIKKGTGELEGTRYEECVYEGYGPNGVAVLIEAMTDNRNRTTPEIKKIFAKLGCSLGESGCVAWQFKRCGVITITVNDGQPEKLLELALESGAEDLIEGSQEVDVVSSVEAFDSVKTAFIDAGVEFSSAEITMLPQNTVKLEGAAAEKMLKLMSELEDHDDVQHVYANFDISTETMEALAT